MKLVMCGVIVVLCGYIGRLFSGRIAQRLVFFRQYQGAFILLADRVVEMNLELHRALEAPPKSPVSEFFGACARMLKKSPQAGLGDLWATSFAKIAPQCTYLNKEDKSLILDGGEAVEALCRNPSEKQARAYIKRIESYIAQIEAEKGKKCKLYNTTSLLAGLFIALLII